MAEEEITAEEQIRQISEDIQKAVQYAANLEVIRINRWIPWDDWKQKIGGLNTTTENLDLEPLEPGWLYIVNNLVGLETGSTPTRIALGYVRTGRFYIMEKSAPAAANSTVEYTGQLILHEGDVIRAQFIGATASDTIEIFVNGYKIRP